MNKKYSYAKFLLKESKKKIAENEAKTGSSISLEEKKKITRKIKHSIRGRLVGISLATLSAITSIFPQKALALNEPAVPEVQIDNTSMAEPTIENSLDQYKVEVGNSVVTINSSEQEITNPEQISKIIEDQIKFSLGGLGNICTLQDGSKMIDINISDISKINFELPLMGAAGMANCDLNVRKEGNSGAELIKTIPGGTRFTFLEEEGDYVKIAINGDKSQIGYVYKDYCLINMPDVIRSLQYNDPNNSEALFESNGYSLDGVTGEKLGDARNHNRRVNKKQDEIMAAFPAAKSMQIMNYNAMLNGYYITVVNGFRPKEIQDVVKNSLQDEYNSNSAVREAIDKDGWSLSWFIATGVSEHQMGGAFDVEASQFDSIQTENNNGIITFVPIESKNSIKDSPSSIHDLSSNGVILSTPESTHTSANDVYSILISNSTPEEKVNATNAYIENKYNNQSKNSKEAMALAKFAFISGFSPLASEWWHFNYIIPNGEIRDYRSLLRDMPGSGGNFKADGISMECSFSIKDAIKMFGSFIDLNKYNNYNLNNDLSVDER